MKPKVLPVWYWTGNVRGPVVYDVGGVKQIHQYGTAAALGNPSCAQVSSGDVACAARSLQQTFLVNTFFKKGPAGAAGRA